MSQQALKFKIGLFVFLALSLFVGSLFFFGLTSFFEKKTSFVSFFNESVRGLNKGSLVRFRGVEIGQVQDIRLSLGGDATLIGIPVTYEIDVSRLQNKLGVPVDISNEDTYEKAIRDGLTAKLSSSSMVTGQLYIDLNFRPTAEAPPKARIFEGDLHYIPAVPSLLSDVSDQLVGIVNQISHINFIQISEHLNDMIVSVDKTVETINSQGTVEKVNDLLASMNQTLMSDDFKNLLAQLGGTAGTMNDFMKNLNTGKGALGEPLANTLNQMAETAKSLDEISQNFARLIESNTGPVADIERTLGDIQEATIAFQSLLEFLRRHPNALIFGKQTP